MAPRAPEIDCVPAMAMRPHFLIRRFALRRSGMLLAAITMAVLLGALAILQYRWVGQLSADERDRMRAHLNTRADGFADDFNRELTRAFFQLQIGPEIRKDVPIESDIDRYERWFASAPRPDLLRAIYQVDTSHAGDPALLHFQRAPARLEPVEWPKELAPIRGRLEETDTGRDMPPGPMLRIPPVWPDVPALVIPRVQIVERTDNRMRSVTMGPSGGYTIAVLDSGMIQRDLIPSLVERHFGVGEDASVYVSIVGPNGSIYTAPAGHAPPALIKSPDVREELFEIRFSEIRRFVLDRQLQPPHSPPPPGQANAPGRAPSMATFNLFRDERGRGGVRGSGGLDFDTGWHLHVLHRAGSLEAAVGHARVRNLIVSFGVLLLLGVSGGMVLVSTGRARRLAAQQMEFVAGVSHELRTPLAVIRSAAENLADGIVGEPKQVRKYGDVIASEGRRLTQMVEQIMDFAGFESGRATLDVRPAEVGAVVEEALRAAAPHLREHGATIEQSAPQTLPLVLIDPGAVSRSLQNLIVNALKYGGSPPHVQLTASATRGEVQLTVTDNGAGVAPGDLPHIFEPFYRGADATSRQIHGSGLGLSLVKRIMDEIGGGVTVTTEAGKGSAFTLHLPIAPEARTAPTPAASTTPAHNV